MSTLPRSAALALPLALFSILTAAACSGQTAERSETAGAESPSAAAGDEPTAAANAHAPRPGGPNRLAGESSPYLLLHKDNPVDWYPWGQEAIDRARIEDKPIFLSVGYSTCYWCHVMERESFSDPAIAAQMNRWFVNVKVDREERPDLDEIYMTATQLLTGRGGWPNSVFLTPDLEPFFAGTYFPPADAMGRPGFPSVLARLHDAWESQRDEVEAASDKVAAAMRQAIAAERQPAPEVPAAGLARRAVGEVAAAYDTEWGGFGGAPKFPTPGRLYLLWWAGEPGGRERGMVAETLRKMGRGGIYDQVGGGFHRYSTDERWRVPHFEKMLYDNAHLAELAAVAAVATVAETPTGDPDLERLARGTLDFVLAEMTLPGGGFKSAIDAETEAEEGAFYVWSPGELREVLGEEGHALLAPVYGFDGEPDFEGGRYVLHLTAPFAEHAARLGISRQALLDRLAPHLAALGRARSRREHPLVDDKVLTDWNGMMIAAMARAGQLLGEPRYLAAAERAAGFVLAELQTPTSSADGPLLHVWRGGEARVPAFLDDYAFLIRGLLALDAATGERRWLEVAKRLADELETRLAAPGGGYYLAAADPDLLFQPLGAMGGAIPAGNGVAAMNLLELAERTGEAEYRRRAERSLRAFAGDLERYPTATPVLAAAVLRYHQGDGAGEARVAAGGGERGRAGGDGREAAGREAGAAATEAAQTRRVEPGEGTTGRSETGGPTDRGREAAGPGEPGAQATREPAAGLSGTRAAAGASAGGTRELARLAREVVAAEVSAEAPGADGWRPFRVRLAIRDGWHVNANPASDEYLVPTRIAAAGAADAADAELRAVAYPPGREERFAFSDQPLAVYQGEVGIPGEASAATAELRLTYQACDDERCLVPVTMTLPFEESRE